MTWRREAEATILKSIDAYRVGDYDALRHAVIDLFSCLEEGVEGSLRKKRIYRNSGEELQVTMEKHSQILNIDAESVHGINAFRLARNAADHKRAVPSRELVGHFIELTLHCLAGMGVLIPDAVCRFVFEGRPHSSFANWVDGGSLDETVKMLGNRVRTLERGLASSTLEAFIKDVESADSRDLLLWEYARLESVFGDQQKLRDEVSQLLMAARNDLRMFEAVTKRLQLSPEMVTFLRLRMSLQEVEQKLANAVRCGDPTEAKNAQQEVDQVRKAAVSASAAVRLKIRKQETERRLENARSIGDRAGIQKAGN